MWCKVFALSISRQTSQVLGCEAARASPVGIDFPCVLAGLGAHQGLVSLHSHCAVPQRWLPMQMFGVAAPSTRCRSGGGAAVTLLPGRDVSCTAPKHSAVGRRRVCVGDCPLPKVPQFGAGSGCAGAAVMTPPLSRSEAGSHPLHLSVTAAAPSALCRSLGRERRTSVGLASALRLPPPHTTAVEWGRR